MQIPLEKHIELHCRIGLMSWETSGKVISLYNVPNE